MILPSLLACKSASDSAGGVGLNRGAAAAVASAAPAASAPIVPATVGQGTAAPPIERRDGAVSVEPEPACGRGLARPDAKSRSTRPHAWLEDAEIQRKQPGAAVARELENWKGKYFGTYLDDDRQALVIVLHTDFADYDTLRQKLEALASPMKLVLRPACHSRQRLDEADVVISKMEWHPRAKLVPMVVRPDASFSGYAVSIDDSAPEVATALEERLGDVVRTQLGKPVPQRSLRSPARRPAE